MKIGIDIDEVIVKFVEDYLRIYEARHGKNISFDSLNTYNFEDHLGLTNEEIDILFNEFYESEKFDNLEFIDGARESLLKISESHEVFIVTFRPLHIKDKTKIFFEKHFSGIPIKVFHSREFSELGGKGKICKDLGIEVMIEDHNDTALDCASRGIKVFLMDKPWNKEIEHENILRVKNWREIMEKIK